jgi:hypothetical protein
MMTRERAEQIRKSVWESGGWHNGTDNPVEVAEIQRFWMSIGRYNSYYDAVSRMARGEHLPPTEGASP